MQHTDSHAAMATATVVVLAVPSGCALLWPPAEACTRSVEEGAREGGGGESSEGEEGGQEEPPPSQGGR